MRLFSVLTLAVCVLFSAFVYAETLEDEVDTAVIVPEPIDRYQIEFVLFKQAAPDQDVLRYERVIRPLGVKEPASRLYPVSSYALSENHLAALKPETEANLSNTVEMLERKGYQVLQSGAWQQELDKESSSLPILLRTPSPTTQTTFWGANIEQEEEVTTDEVVMSSTAREEYFGHLTIRRTRYTHAELVLDYKYLKPVSYRNLINYLQLPELLAKSFVSLIIPPDATAIREADVEQMGTVITNSFRFEESRRVKSGEIHYLDHPALGFIVTIKRLPKPEHI